MLFLPIIFLAIFWSIRTTKFVLFYLYLWQLKEYHVGRFLDHFRTEKGERLFRNWLFFLKILLVLTVLILAANADRLVSWFTVNRYQAITQTSFLYLACFPYLVLFLYFLESIKAFGDIFRKKLKKPVLTKKTAVLILVNLFVAAVFLFYNFSDVPFFTTLFAFPQITLLFDSSFWLLVFDIFTPLITSLIVLSFQPLTVLLRNQLIIKKAKRKREKFKDLLVIGITGSYGKTSTKEFLYKILASKYGEKKVLKTKEHQNSEVGISQCILNDLEPEHEIFIAEMGAYNRGGIKLLCDIAKPKIGILTGINEQHMATFGSQENIIKTKYELVESLPEDGLAIFNGDDEYCFELYKRTKKRKKLYNIFSMIVKNVSSDIWAENLKVREDFISFNVSSKDGDLADFKLNLFGAHNVSNILGAVIIAKELGIDLKETSEVCQKIKAFPKTMELKKGTRGIAIIDDSYSANPAGVRAALNYLKIYSGRKIIVMPCLIELGKASKRVHKRIGEKIGEICDLAIITTKDRFKEIKQGATKSGMKKENILFLKDPKEIFEKIRSYTTPENVILLESRVPERLIDKLIIK